ncbi:MAG: L,D-transpeptidase Cds6 family protein [Betaproteobacteria bacterium]
MNPRRIAFAAVMALWAGPGVAASGDLLVEQAIRYEHAEGVPRSYARAAELYCDAVRLGHAEAAYRLGWMYAYGRGLERNDELAAALFRRAAAQGHDHAKRAHALVNPHNIVTPRAAGLPACLSEKQPDVARLQKELEVERAKLDAARAALVKAAAVVAAPAGAQAEVAAALERWAQAWSRRDVQGYLATYAPDFAVPAGHSRKSWATERARRITDKSAIAVELRLLEIDVDGEHARARFVQDYRSDRFSDRTAKTVDLVRSAGSWLIQRETAR